MSGIAIISLLVCAVFGLWAMINPRSMFWSLTAWQYRHPKAVEPSDAAYSATRVSGGIMLVFIVGLTIWYATTTAEIQSEQQAHSNCQNVLLPALKQKIAAGSTSGSEMQSFATEHGLTLKVTSSNVPTFDPHQSPAWPPAKVAVPTYHFQQDGREVLTWTDDGSLPLPPECKV